MSEYHHVEGIILIKAAVEQAQRVSAREEPQRAAGASGDHPSDQAAAALWPGDAGMMPFVEHLPQGAVAAIEHQSVDGIDLLQDAAEQIVPALMSDDARWMPYAADSPQGDDSAATSIVAAEAPAPAALDRVSDRLAVIERLLEALAKQGSARSEAELAATLTALERQVARAGREQFKASTLAEALRDQLTEAVETFRAADARLAEEVAAVHARAAATLADMRIAQAKALLPALDGLEEALRSGRRLAAERAAQPSRGPRPWPWGRRAESPAESPYEHLAAWLEGLGFVRDRLLGVLLAAGVTPIPAQGRPFDPGLHVAFEVAPPSAEHPPGTIAAVIRQGFRAGEQVLRPAEVAVTRDATAVGETT